MCGIAGFITVNAPSNGRGLLERMTNVIAHRGPDENGYYEDQHAFLGHRRLSIIDLSTGQQPMTNEDGTRWIIYNGELFNHNSVRPELESAGHRYKTHSDTETLLHAYEQWGAKSIDRFRGMFAYVIWDPKQKELFCVRDRLGIKPFYYYFDGQVFAFASEIKALLEHPAISVRMEDGALNEVLAFGYASGEQTLYRGIRKLMPGHHMTIRVAGSHLEQRIEQYWDAPTAVASPERSEQEWIAELRRRLEETVRMRLMADVPLGVFLSGGLDSSAIAALMKQMIPGPLKTFSVGYDEEQYSELGYAKRVADYLGTEHHEVRVGMPEFFNTLPKLVWHEDEPICWPSSVSLYYVSKLAREHVTVVLTGEGSDELFAGYARYAHYLKQQEWLPYYRMLPGGVRKLIRDQVATSSMLSATWRRKLQHTFVGLEDNLSSLYLDNFYSAFGQQAQQRMLSRGVSPVYDNFARYWDQAAGAAPLQRMLYADQKTYLQELLMKQDQMSMACSLESRVPLLDHTFVEFAATVPDSMKLRGSGKYIFKKAVEDILPHDIIYRRKMGFPTPMRQWLREKRAEPLYKLLRDREGLLASIMKREALDDLIRKQQEGIEDCTDRLWRLINVQVWGDVFLTGRMSRHDELLDSPVGAGAPVGAGKS